MKRHLECIVLAALLASAALAQTRSESAKIKAPDAFSDDWFGATCALDGDVALLGAPFADEPFFNHNSGVAHLYARDSGGPGMWGELRKLVASSPSPNANFGRALTLRGDVAAVADDLESVWIFLRDSGGPDKWGEHKHLLSPERSGASQFGRALAVDGPWLVVGAP